MARKEKTPEERKAWGAKMKAAREAKKALEADVVKEPVHPEPQAETSITQEDYQSLLKQVQELKQALTAPVPQGPQVAGGRLVGTVERYVVDPKHYPDPSERLSREPRLQRFAFPINYELEFTVSDTSYETIDGVRQREPRFNLELHRVVLDEDTGGPTAGRYVIRKATFHEDPQAAVTVARENGLEVDETNQRAFLDEMRYIRMRDWLFDAFFPPKSSKVQTSKKEMVVGNRLVEYFEVSSEDPSSLPFSGLKGKV